MHRDLLLLRVACRVVEEDDGKRPTEEEERVLPPTHPPVLAAPESQTKSTAHLPRPVPSGRTDMSTGEAQRIPRVGVRASSGALATHGAGLMLGLRTLAAHAMQNPIVEHPDVKPTLLGRRRSPSPGGNKADDATTHTTTRHDPALIPHPPHKRARIDSATSRASTLLPPMMMIRTRHGSVGDQTDGRSLTRAAPASLVSFLGHKHKRGEDRLPGFTESTSPTSVWEEAQSSDACSSSNDEDRSPVKPSISVLRVPTIPQWRVPSLPHSVVSMLSPTPPTLQQSQGSPLPSLSLAALSRSTPSIPSPVGTPSPASVTTRPKLVRKTSAQWRQEMPVQDREKTRSRLQRGFNNQCRGDYAVLLEIVSALEEELLYMQTTSNEHYALQAAALQDRIKALAASRVLPPRRDSQSYER